MAFVIVLLRMFEVLQESSDYYSMYVVDHVVQALVRGLPHSHAHKTQTPAALRTETTGLGTSLGVIYQCYSDYNRSLLDFNH